MTIGKEFVLSHVFKDAANMKEDKYYHSDHEEHFNAPWKITVIRRTENLAVYLYCMKPMEDTEWSIQAEFEAKLITTNGKSFSQKLEKVFDNKNGIQANWGWSVFISWEEMKSNYLIDNNLTVEFNVKINKIAGIPMTKLLNFDETMKEFSDVVLNVNDEKFYVSKLFLAYQSTYFKSLLLGNFEESKKSEIKLDDIDSDDFQKFLEVLHGQSAIDDSNVEGILVLADMYDAQTAIQRCEEFLIKESKQMLKMKLQLSTYYKLDNLKKKCLSEISTAAEVRAILPDDIENLDPTIAAHLLKKLAFATDVKVPSQNIPVKKPSMFSRFRK